MVTKAQTWTEADNVDAVNAIAVKIPSATTAQLASLTADINTINKAAGCIVYNTTSTSIVVSEGALAADVWNTAAGVTAHTPI